MKQNNLTKQNKQINAQKSVAQNKLRVAGGRGLGEGVWIMDIGEGEGMCFGECCEVCKPGDSQTCTPGDKNI